MKELPQVNVICLGEDGEIISIGNHIAEEVPKELYPELAKRLERYIERLKRDE